MAVVQGIEIHNSAGTRLDTLRYVYDGTWKQAINSADVLTFTVPTEHAGNDLVIGNECWVKRGDAATLARKFVITRLEYHEGAERKIVVQAHDPLILLAQTPVTEYPLEEDRPDDSMINALDFCEYILALQSNITWGTLPPISSDHEIKWDKIHVKDTNVLAAIHKVREEVGGMIYVDNDKKLHWVNFNLRPIQAYALELDRNTISKRRVVDGITGEDIAAYEVEVVDLSAHGGADDTMIQIGGLVSYMIDESTSETLVITDIEQSLDNPLQVKIVVSDDLQLTGRVRDILDYILDVTDPTDSVETRLDALSEVPQDIEDIRQDILDMSADATNYMVWRGSLAEEPDPPALSTGRASWYYNTLADKYYISKPGGPWVVMGGDAAEYQVTEVLALPAIPTVGTRRVRWLSPEENVEATGDGQIWESWVGATQWYPANYWTDASGVPE